MKPILASLFFAACSLSHGATLAVSDVTLTAYNASIEISPIGTLDWAVWKGAASTTGASNAPAESKLNGTAISNLTAIGGGTAGFRASETSAPNWDFSFTDGTSTPGGTVTNANGVFHPDTGSNGKGVGLTVTLPTTDTYLITLFVAGYLSNTSLTVSLPGHSDVTNTSFKPENIFGPGNPDNVKVMGYFTIEATADTAGDLLTLGIVNTSTTTNSHVMISAVAVQPIPEPSATAALLSAGLLALRRRRILP